MIQPPRFMTTLMRVGYDQPEVDLAVDRVMAAFALDEPGIDAAEVEGLRFRRVNYRQGYDMEQVDDWLGDVVDELRRREAGALPSASAPTTPAYVPAAPRPDAVTRVDDRSTRVAMAWGLAVVAVVLLLVAVL